MFEIIGIVVVSWLAVAVIRTLLAAKRGSSSKEFGLETRRIATQELFIPNPYYNYITTNHMDDLKQQALVLRDGSAAFARTSWPRLLALSLFTWFYNDCNKFHSDDPSRIHLFRQLQIEPQVIATTLMQDASQVIASHL